MGEIVQGTQEWKDARAGHITASHIKDVMTNPRKGQKVSTIREAYMAQLINERLTEKVTEKDIGSYEDIQRGKRLEPIARVEYEFRQKVTVDTVGFVKHPRLPGAGCSPDGKVGKNLVQFKAPRLHIFMDWRINGIVPPEHKDQMLFELSCHPEAEWNDFCAYVEELTPDLQLFVVRLYRDEPRIAQIEAAVARFNTEIEEKMVRLAASDKTLQEKLEYMLAVRKSGVGESVAETR